MGLQIYNETRGKLLADKAVRASSFQARFVGLMGRRVFPLGEALHIEPCNSIHTFFMRLPIDLVFLDGDHKAVRVVHALPPWRATSLVWAAKSVIEFPAGVLAASGTLTDDKIVFRAT